MIDLDWCFNFTSYCSAILLGAVGLFIIGSSTEPDKRQQRYYRITMLLSMLISLTEIVSVLVSLNKDWVMGRCVTELLLENNNVLLFPIVTAWLLHICGEPLRRNPAFYTVCTLMALKSIIAVTYFIKEPLHYLESKVDLRSPFVISHIIVGILLFILNIVILVRRWGQLTKGQRLLFVVCDFMSPELMILFLELYFIHNQNKRNIMYKKEIIKQQEEIIKQKEYLVKSETQVAVLQMRPHFIYNTLMSIYYLCQQDADKAQQVILDFSRYLKKNFTAIVSENTVPFSEELEHTRAYLAVEKVRFEDKLFVEFDTPVTFFKLPPLTLQPIVENSVKYGVSPGLDPLYLSIVTEESDEGVAIIVEDTGPGFYPSNDNEPHIALDNIRERLKTMCGGSLEITPREDGGTKVTILIPMKQTKDQ